MKARLKLELEEEWDSACRELKNKEDEYPVLVCEYDHRTKHVYYLLSHSDFEVMFRSHNSNEELHSGKITRLYENPFFIPERHLESKETSWIKQEYLIVTYESNEEALHLLNPKTAGLTLNIKP